MTELLTDPTTGQVHQRLRPVFDAIVDGERPQSAIYWLMRRERIGPGLLAAMARGELDISHDTFRALLMDRTHNYVRDLLVGCGVLPPYEPLLDRMIPYLATVGEALDPHHGRILDQYARWKVMRHLHRKADQHALTKGTYLTARLRLRRVAAFLTWLETRGRSIETATQTDLEDHLVAHPKSVANALGQYLTWLRDTGINTRLGVDIHRTVEPRVTMSDDDRWEHVRLLLHQDSIRLYVRIGGLFMLLFAQPVTDICRMRTDQVDLTDPDRAMVTFEATPIQMPDPLADLIRTHLARRGQASYASRDNGWLFPGGIPGRPLVTEGVRRQLVELGIHPHSARQAALFALSA